MAPDASKLQRLQGCFVSDHESQRLVQFWKSARSQAEPENLMGDEMGDTTESGQPEGSETGPAPTLREPIAGDAASREGRLEPPWLPGQEMLQQPLWGEAAAAETAAGGDDLYRQAIEEVRKSGKASVSLLQRKLRIGYSRAARLIDQMESEGIVGPDQGGTRGREVLPENRAQRAGRGRWLWRCRIMTSDKRQRMKDE